MNACGRLHLDGQLFMDIGKSPFDVLTLVADPFGIILDLPPCAGQLLANLSCFVFCTVLPDLCVCIFSRALM